MTLENTTTAVTGLVAGLRLDDNGLAGNAGNAGNAGSGIAEAPAAGPSKRRNRRGKGRGGSGDRGDRSTNTTTITDGNASQQQDAREGRGPKEKENENENEKEKPRQKQRQKQRPAADATRGRGRGRGGRSVGGGRQFSGALTGSEPKEEASLSSSLGAQLAQSSYECMICCDSVRPRHAIWQCDTCWAIFHLPCVKRWAAASTSTGASAGSGSGTSSGPGSRWRCPGCQHARAAAPSHYVCFCGATRNPEPARTGGTPHGCGRICGRRRGAHCPHACPQPCHPGPCAPCTALAPEQACFCGRVAFRPRCGAGFDPVAGAQSCGAVCGETLGCGQHACAQPCHAGLCAPCAVPQEQRCLCARHTRQARCGAPPRYACKDTCGALLGCGRHRCARGCHAQDEPGCHDTCALDPARAPTCHCGAAKADRASCADAVPSCGSACRRALGCGHACAQPCHAGPCAPCAEPVAAPCRCGAAVVRGTCGTPLLCARTCGAKRSCRRHRCAAQCCGDAAHACTLQCGRQLACKAHTCGDACHRGACAPCAHTSPDALACGCGRTRIAPPVACGTAPPACRLACPRTRACGHFSPAPHECHSGACPPCAVLIAAACMCGARELRSVPCHRAGAASCGRICARLLPCGGHRCERSCHRAGDACLAPGAACRQACGKPRRACGHACVLPCHTPKICDETQPCAATVVAACPCGRLQARQRCGATELRAERLAVHCDDLCRLAERNRRVSLALGFPDQAAAPLDGLARIRYSDDVLRFARAHLAWVREIEALAAGFIAERARPALHFAPMKQGLRAFLHALAPVYGCAPRSVDREPQRSVCWDRAPGSCVPSIPVSSAVRYTQPPTVVCSDRVNAVEGGGAEAPIFE
ncbi:FKBP12-associated protein, partial [Kickxella alabastrina]